MIHLILRLLYLLLLTALAPQQKGLERLVLPLQVLIVITRTQAIQVGLLVKQVLRKGVAHLLVHLRVHPLVAQVVIVVHLHLVDHLLVQVLVVDLVAQVAAHLVLLVQDLVAAQVHHLNQVVAHLVLLVQDLAVPVVVYHPHPAQVQRLLVR